MRASAIIGRAGSGARTYAEFQAHIATLATNGSYGWGTNPAAGAFRTTAAGEEGFMIGSSWSAPISFNAATARIIQHGMPSEAAFLAQSGRELFFRLVSGFYGTFPSVDRNGYSSFAGGGGGGFECTEIIYWDGVQAQRMTPFNGGGPTPYSWT